MKYWSVFFLVVFVGLGTFISLFFYIQKNKIPNIYRNLLVVLLSIFLTLVMIEFYFKNFYSESDNLRTLARQNWKQWHFEDQKNSFGFRDIEWTDELLKDKHTVISAGDSFVYGAGIAKMKDRYTDVLAQKLGRDFAVINLGSPGANTKKIYENIKDYPHEPDIVILSYYMNDIEDASTTCMPERGPLLNPPKFLKPFINKSYALNFFYWRIARGLESMKPNGRAECLIGIFNDRELWESHKQDLLSIYNFVDLQGAELFVVVFPHLYLDIHNDTTANVVSLFNDLGVYVVDVNLLIEDVPLRDRVPSLMDLHASALVNKMIAEDLYNKFVEAGIVSPNRDQ